MKTLRRFAVLLVLSLVVVACGDDDATTTTGAETTTTVAETTTTVTETTTTTLGTGALFDPFDGITPATPYWPSTTMGFDLSVEGFLTISSLEHSALGEGISYFATYNHVFRDGVITMVFRPGAEHALRYSMLRLARIRKPPAGSISR